MRSGSRRRSALRKLPVQMLALQTLLGCLLFFPFVDLWMAVLAWLVPDAGQPAVVALLLSTLMAAICAWKLPKLAGRVLAALRARR